MTSIGKSIKEQQRNWIGRSEGASIFFKVAGHEDKSVEVYDSSRYVIRCLIHGLSTRTRDC